MPSWDICHQAIECLRIHEAFAVQPHSHVDEMMGSDQGVAAVRRQHDQQVGAVVLESDVRFGERNFLQSQVQEDLAQAGELDASKMKPDNEHEEES